MDSDIDEIDLPSEVDIKNWLENTYALPGKNRDEVINGAAIEYFRNLSSPTSYEIIASNVTNFFPDGISSAESLEYGNSLVLDNAIAYYAALLNTYRQVYSAYAMDPLFMSLLINGGFDKPNVRRMAKDIIITNRGKGAIPARILLPYNYRTIHWVLILVDLKMREIVWYDSIKAFQPASDDSIFKEEDVRRVYAKVLELISFLYAETDVTDPECYYMWSLQEGTFTPEQVANLRCGFYVMAGMRILFFSGDGSVINLRLKTSINVIREHISKEQRYKTLLTDCHFGETVLLPSACMTKMVITRHVLCTKNFGVTNEVYYILGFKRIKGILAGTTSMDFAFGEEYPSMVVSQCAKVYVKSDTPFNGFNTHIIPTLLEQCRIKITNRMYNGIPNDRRLLSLCQVISHLSKRALIFTTTDIKQDEQAAPFHFMIMCCLISTMLRTIMVNLSESNPNEESNGYIEQLVLKIPQLSEYSKTFKTLKMITFAKFGCFSLVKLIHNELLQQNQDITVYNAMNHLMKTTTLIDSINLFLHSGFIAHSYIKILDLKDKRADTKPTQGPANGEFYSTNDKEVVIYANLVADHIMAHHFPKIDDGQSW